MITPGVTIVSHAGNIKWLALATAGLRAVLPAATLALLFYTARPLWRVITGLWQRQPISLTDVFGAGLFGYSFHLGLGFFGKRVYSAITTGRSLGFDQGATDQWTSAYFLLGGSLCALAAVWAVSRDEGRARIAVPLTIASMLVAGIGFAFLYALQQHAL